MMDFTNDWFGATGRYIWEKILPQLGPKRILEVGSYEGRSTCFLIETLPGPLEIHCIDTWKGSKEHVGTDMDAVRKRFESNIKIASQGKNVQVTDYVERSDLALAKMQDKFAKHFDFIYIDGSHKATDVLCDAVLAFRLLRSGGVMCFDDYLWRDFGPYDPLNSPKVAIDTFTLIYSKQLHVMALPPTQLFIEKL